MRTYFAYIRVSTVRQGEKGSSLQEQRDAILRYAAKNNIKIIEWYEEQVTAAKRGRVVFRRMLTRLKKGHAFGLVMHKVDRGARNLADWAELASLMDHGIDVHFAHEGIDLSTRGSRLSADIQAVVAADYVRNLRDEVKKGLQGRLKQGIYPFGVMTGYVSQGGGRPKTIDPIQGPLVRETFEKYATGRYTLRTLSAEMNARGLRNSAGGKFHITAMAKLLRTTFYFGLIEVKGQTYIGKHEPLITKELFDAVRKRADDRVYPRTKRVNGTDYAFRRMLTCSRCQHSLYAEVQKRNTYYRCHSNGCQGTSVNERTLFDMVSLELSFIHEGPTLTASLQDHLNMSDADQAKLDEAEIERIELALGKQLSLERRLTDLFIEGALDQAEYDTRKKENHSTRLLLEQSLLRLQKDNQQDECARFFELLNGLKNIAQIENPTEKREMLETALSNSLVSGKSVDLQWVLPLQMMIDMGGSLGVRPVGTNLDHGSSLSPTVNQITTPQKKVRNKEAVVRPVGTDIEQGSATSQERQERFLKALDERSGELYRAIVNENKLRNWISNRLSNELLN
jgi:site-specific DNA recombinase